MVVELSPYRISYLVGIRPISVPKQFLHEGENICIEEQDHLFQTAH